MWALVLVGCPGGDKDARAKVDDCTDGSVAFEEGIPLRAAAHCEYAARCGVVPTETYQECLDSYLAQYSRPECELVEEEYHGGLVCECIALQAGMECGSVLPGTCLQPWWDCDTVFTD